MLGQALREFAMVTLSALGFFFFFFLKTKATILEAGHSEHDKCCSPEVKDVITSKDKKTVTQLLALHPLRGKG